MAKQRIYIIKMEGELRLVKALNKNLAMTHVAKDLMDAQVATQEQLVEVLNQGIKIEETIKEPA